VRGQFSVESPRHGTYSRVQRSAKGKCVSLLEAESNFVNSAVEDPRLLTDLATVPVTIFSHELPPIKSLHITDTSPLREADGCLGIPCYGSLPRSQEPATSLYLTGAVTVAATICYGLDVRDSIPYRGKRSFWEPPGLLSKNCRGLFHTG
jgi:hypothetical protein